MNFVTNKEKGNSALGIAIAYFTTNGYVVSIPLNDTQERIPYNFISVAKSILRILKYLIEQYKIATIKMVAIFLLNLKTVEVG